MSIYLNIKSMEDFNNKALGLASAALDRTDRAILTFTSHESLPKPIACKIGCHYCCFNHPVVTPPEALLIGHHIEQTFMDHEKQGLIHRIKHVVDVTKDKTPDEIALIRYELPCIFLKDGMCMVYKVRPVVCRTCTSIDAEHCKNVFESRDHMARLRCYHHIRDIFQRVQKNLVNQCMEMGCQSDLLFMAEAIRDYFKIPNATEAWLQGKRIFTGYFC
ncbi:MAG: YkgJ family cysteine cluster protein [Deltaproteobacteria bacterium]|nr:YkgJ family cysteine cluster protein [Deltaproteobacteria bacterium]MBW2088794.1 YkgJ family cysteine cluster protein [Deltaproteobacteria bacterium]